MKKVNILSCLLLMVVGFSVTFAYESPTPETVYSTSQNKNYLVQIFPLRQTSGKTLTKPINREKLTVVVYEKKTDEVAGDIYVTWEEISFFRTSHPDDYGERGAEVKRVLISNDGNSIVIESRLNPTFAKDMDVVFFYNRKGQQLAHLSRNALTRRDENSLYRHSDLYIDNTNKQLVVKYDKEIIKYKGVTQKVLEATEQRYSLTNGKLIN